MNNKDNQSGTSRHLEATSQEPGTKASQILYYIVSVSIFLVYISIFRSFLLSWSDSLEKDFQSLAGCICLQVLWDLNGRKRVGEEG